MNRGRPIAIAQNATDGDDDDVTEEVFAIACMTRIGQRLKVRTNRFDINELRHGNILEIEANRPAVTFAFNDCSRSKDMAHRPRAQDPYITYLCALALGSRPTYVVMLPNQLCPDRRANSRFRSAVYFHHDFFGAPSMNRTAAMN